MWLLIASLVASLLGPISFEGVRRRRGMMAGLDGFVLVSLLGLLAFDLLPQSLDLAGWWAIAAGIVGFAGPLLIGRWSPHGSSGRAELPVVALAAGGLACHAMLDGLALVAHEVDGGAAAGPLGGGMMAVAVLVHRLPVGLTLWWIVKPSWGAGWAMGLLGVNLCATTLGFLLGPEALAQLPLEGMGAFEALVAGSLFHVVFHHPPELREGPPVRFAAGMGGLVGVALLAVIGMAHGPSEAHTVRPWDAFLVLALESAPALLVAFAAAGLLRTLLRPASLGWLGRGGAWAQVGKGTAFGLPLPICSCGVLPLYHGLIQSGVPATAAVAFLVATPELGIDALLVSVPLLGAELTAARLVAAVSVTMVAGLVVGTWIERRRAPPQVQDAPVELAPVRARVWVGLRYGFGELVDHTFPWILAGLTIASLIEPALDESWFVALPRGVDVLVLALVGMPIYICASGSTPLVAVLVAHGVSPGAAIAFLLTGPATNATTFGVLSRLHGKRAAILFAGVVSAASVGLGLLVNQILPAAQGIQLALAATAPSSLLERVSLGALALLVAASLLRMGPRALMADMMPDAPEPEHACADGCAHPDHAEPHDHSHAA